MGMAEKSEEGADDRGGKMNGIRCRSQISYSRRSSLIECLRTAGDFGRLSVLKI